LRFFLNFDHFFWIFAIFLNFDHFFFEFLNIFFFNFCYFCEILTIFWIFDHFLKFWPFLNFDVQGYPRWSSSANYRNESFGRRSVRIRKRFIFPTIQKSSPKLIFFPLSNIALDFYIFGRPVIHFIKNMDKNFEKNHKNILAKKIFLRFFLIFVDIFTSNFHRLDNT